MARKRPTPTLHRFHPAAMNPVVVARPDNESAPGATPVNPNSPRFTTPEPKPTKPNRSSQIRRDDDNVKDISLTLYDVDFNVKRYIEQQIDPYIVLILANSNMHLYLIDALLTTYFVQPLL